MIGIVDYNAGNIKSVERALLNLNAQYKISGKPQELEKADKIIFPGVGDAFYAMEQLKKTGFDSFLKDYVQSGKPLAGICLGSQIVFDYSEEGDTECLGLLKGKIRHFKNLIKDTSNIKIPHMGWNDIQIINGSSKYLEGINSGDSFYFVHSYVIVPDDETIVKAYSDYNYKVPAVVEKDNITVFQFHPEKSGEKGMQILKNFISL